MGKRLAASVANFCHQRVEFGSSPGRDDDGGAMIGKYTRETPAQPGTCTGH